MHNIYQMHAQFETVKLCFLLDYRSIRSVPPADSFDPIARELSALLDEAPLRNLFFAEGNLPPPPLAFLVHFPRMSITLSGSDQMEIELNGKCQTIKAERGDVVFVPPNCWDKPTWTQPGKVLHLLFGNKHLGISLVENDGPNPEAIHTRKTSAHRVIGGPMQSILNALIDLRTESPVPRLDRLLIEALLHCTLLLLNDPPKATGSKARITYDRVCLYVQENHQKALTRDSVASALNLSPNHLSRLFRQEGMMSFIDYLTWVRINRAKFLLKHYEYSLTDISSACGYYDTAYFCRVFKSKTKLTPNQYRQQIRDKHPMRTN
ncbi:MAG: helix-turn-helix domain-containing protein [Chthoniobacteraceae bacterium]